MSEGRFTPAKGELLRFAASVDSDPGRQAGVYNQQLERGLDLFAKASIAQGSGGADPEAVSRLMQLRRNSDAAIAFENRVRRASIGETSQAGQTLREYQGKRFQLLLLEGRMSELYRITDVAAIDFARQRANIESEITNLQANLSSMLGKIGADPGLASAQTEISPVTLASASDALRDDEALVEISLLQDNVIAVIARRLRNPEIIITPANKDELLRDLLSVRSSVQPVRGTADPPPYDLGAAFHAYNKLIQPLESALIGIKVMYVVADDEITRTPLGALTTQPPKLVVTTDYRSVDFVVKRPFAIALLPSVSTLVRERNSLQPSRATKLAFVMAASPYDDDHPVDETCLAHAMGAHVAVRRSGPIPGIPCTLQKLGPLGNANSLASDLRRSSLGANGLIEVADTKGANTVSALRHKDLQEFRIIVIMAHSLPAIPQEGLSDPALVLRVPDNPSPDDNGLLTTSEISELRFDANMVMLLGCDTEASRSGTQQTLSGLGRAFLGSGARSLLVTQWQIRPDSIPIFTRKFFQELWAGRSRAEAARLASLQFLDSNVVSLNAWTHPFYWASFTVVGDASEVNMNVTSGSPQ